MIWRVYFLQVPYFLQFSITLNSDLTRRHSLSWDFTVSASLSSIFSNQIPFITQLSTLGVFQLKCCWPLGWNSYPQVGMGFECLASLAPGHKIPGARPAPPKIFSTAMTTFTSNQDSARQLTVVFWPHHFWVTCLPALYLNPQAYRVISYSKMVYKGFVFL